MVIEWDPLEPFQIIFLLDFLLTTMGQALIFIATKDRVLVTEKIRNHKDLVIKDFNADFG